MKKFICLLMALLMTGSFVACAVGTDDDYSSSSRSKKSSSRKVDDEDEDEDDERYSVDEETQEELDNLENEENQPEDGAGADLDTDDRIVWVSGTKNCYTFENNVLTFTNITEDTEYSLSGELDGNIVIDVGVDYKFDLTLNGFSLKSSSTNPIMVLSGSEVGVKAKKDTVNYIYDKREAIDETDTTLYSGAIHSLVDLEIGGKGTLSISSDNNNGIHSKDDLQVKNLTLLVTCQDNALKGNDSVEITSGKLTLIAKTGDGIKTTNSDISEKGNQRGTITINDTDVLTAPTAATEVNVYAACDGLDAAYDVSIEGETTVVNIYTDTYSTYSEEVTATSSTTYYLKVFSSLYSGGYTYSIQYMNSSSSATTWVNPTYHSTSSSGGGMGGGNSTYYYYTFAKPSEEYDKMRLFIYASGTSQQQETTYFAVSEWQTINASYDTFSVSNSSSSSGRPGQSSSSTLSASNLSYSWTNYTTSSTGNQGGAGGGMQEGNSDKGAYSTKGIKAANAISIAGGTIFVKAYDDAIHGTADTTIALENGAYGTGDVTISGGVVSVYSNDDGLHADGVMTISGGTVSVTNSYEGVEGSSIVLSGGSTSIKASDDGMNACATSGTNITVSGGTHYIYCTGDGVDSNSTSSYSAIAFQGGKMVVIANSNGNSAIDSDGGYSYTGGYVLAIMPSGGMTSESTHCSNFSSVGKSTTISSASYISATVSSSVVVCVQMPVTISNAFVVFLGSSSATVASASSASGTLDSNGVYWK